MANQVSTPYPPMDPNIATGLPNGRTINIFSLLRNREIGEINPNFNFVIKKCADLYKSIQQNIKGIRRLPGLRYAILGIEVDARESSTLERIIDPFDLLGIRCIQIRKLTKKEPDRSIAFKGDSDTNEGIKNIYFDAFKQLDTFKTINTILSERKRSKSAFEHTIRDIYNDTRENIKNSFKDKFDNEFRPRSVSTTPNTEWENDKASSIIDSLRSYISSCEEKESIVLREVRNNPTTNKDLKQLDTINTAIVLIAAVALGLYIMMTEYYT